MKKIICETPRLAGVMRRSRKLVDLYLTLPKRDPVYLLQSIALIFKDGT